MLPENHRAIEDRIEWEASHYLSHMKIEIKIEGDNAKNLESIIGKKIRIREANALAIFLSGAVVELDIEVLE